MKKILFICTHNSARSQMAEGLTNHFFSDKWQAYSAGTEKTKVKELAIKAMDKIGIDITHQFSKRIDHFKGWEFDLVVTVCDNAQETCPFYPGKNVIHKSFKDPSSIKGDKNEKLKAFCNTRDEIYNWLKTIS